MATAPLLNDSHFPADIRSILPHKYCCSMSQHSLQLQKILEQLDELTPFQKTTLLIRVIAITESLRKRMVFFAWIFHLGRFIVTGGSLIVPALLSIQTPTGTSPPMFWSTWTVSLLVTLSNAILTLFKVEKKYYSIHTSVEQIYSEVWQYVQLTGRYSGALLKHTKDKYPTHKNQFIYISQAIERIHLRQVQDEYFKVQEASEFHGSSSLQSQSDTSQPKPMFATVSANLEDLAKKRAELERDGTEALFSQVPNIEEQLPLKESTAT